MVFNGRRSTSRAIVSRKHDGEIAVTPKTFDIYRIARLVAPFYRRYSTGVETLWNTVEAKQGWAPLASRKHFALPMGSAGDASIKIANSANGFRRLHSFRASIAPLDTLRRRNPPLREPRRQCSRYRETRLSWYGRYLLPSFLKDVHSVHWR